ADKKRDHEVLKAGARTQLDRQGDTAADERMIELLDGKKLDGAQTFKCPVTTLSNVIDTYGVKRVSLVKVSVECAENIVLAGIREGHWALIDQLVVEVHDQGAREHELMRDRLMNKGYQVELLAESSLENSGIFEIIARR